MDTSPEVFTAWPWIDYTRSKLALNLRPCPKAYLSLKGPLEIVWTVGENWYTWINIGIGVAFGVTQSSLERLVTHLLAWLCYGYYLRYSAKHERLLQGSSPKSKPSWWENFKNEYCTRNFSAKMISGLLLFTIITWAVAGSFVTTIPANKAAMLASNKCGLWLLGDTDNEAGLNNDALLSGEREKRAAQYARNCYPPNSASGLDQCLLFKTPYISSYMEQNQLCPFVNKTYCDGTGVEAVRFTTHAVQSTRIGVNSGEGAYFKRSAICAPLNMKDQSEGGPGFIEKTRNNAIGYWGYKLGLVDSDGPQSPYTFEQKGDPWDYNDVRAYTMR